MTTLSDNRDVFEAIYPVEENDKELLNLPNTSAINYRLMNATSSNYKVLSHVLLSSNKKNFPLEGDVNSEFYSHYKTFFLKVCEWCNVEVNTIFRAAINLTYHYKELYGEVHTDHGFPHKNFIFCLNDFSAGSTYLFNQQFQITKELKQLKNKVSIFPGELHAQGFCNPGEYRNILIFTFA